MKCPNCHEPLKKVTKVDKKIDTCLNCGGMYLHKGELNALTPQHEGVFSHSDFEASSVDYSPTINEPRVVPCAYCENNEMKKINFLSTSDIVLDYCTDCGSFWLDGGELEKIHKFSNEIEEKAKGAHDPFMIQLVNFFKMILLR